MKRKIEIDLKLLKDIFWMMGDINKFIENLSARGDNISSMYDGIILMRKKLLNIIYPPQKKEFLVELKTDIIAWHKMFYANDEQDIKAQINEKNKSRNKQMRFVKIIMEIKK